MTRAGPSFPWVVLFSLIVLLAVVGCDETTNPCRPEVNAGRIQGRVLTGGLPIDARIEAARVVDGHVADNDFETDVDASGFYQLDVPDGDYIVMLVVGGYLGSYKYARPTPSYGNVPPDTVRVDAPSSPVIIDFELAGLEVDVELSNQLNGRNCLLYLHRREADELGYWTYVDRGDAEVNNGRVSFKVPGVLPGEYRIEILLGWFGGERIWMPGTHDVSEAAWYECAPDSLVDLSCVLSTEPARIEGRIVGAWRDFGYPSPDLYVVTIDSVAIVDQRGTYSDGSFAVDLHLAEPVKLRVSQSGIDRWIGGPSFDDATIFAPALGETISGVELVQSGIRFRVDAPEQYVGTPVLRLYDAADLSQLGAVEAYLGFGRNVGIANLWPGDFLVQVTPRDVGYSSWISQWFDGATSAAEAQVITISGAGEIVALDLTLELGGMISGRVEKTTGSPGDWYVFLTPADDHSLWGDFQVYTNPTFVIRGLPDGAFKAGCRPRELSWKGEWPPPEGIIWYPGTSDWDSAGVIEILDASVVSDLVIVVP